MRRGDQIQSIGLRAVPRDHHAPEGHDDVLRTIEQRAIAFAFTPSPEHERALEGALDRAQSALAERDGALELSHWRTALERLIHRAIAVGVARAEQPDRHPLVRAREERLAEAQRELENVIAPRLQTCRSA